jgi:ribonuclease T1
MLCKTGRLWRVAAAAFALSLATVAVTPALAKGQHSAEKPAESTIAAAQLPVQGQQVLALIYQGGPFRYEKDGTVFGNRERLLPLYPRGYYREYTVRTPGVSHRGARRMVCGGKVKTTPDVCYYTEDHYASFRRIVP